MVAVSAANMRTGGWLQMEAAESLPRTGNVVTNLQQTDASSKILSRALKHSDDDSDDDKNDDDDDSDDDNDDDSC
ncbi:hypothetical protein V7S43_007580 [Phytophthora oleae]|uniref:Uncharacterized protein n=1 Tax=Phytophthora oleae TaxID=2107226 RepID=A0ABD3FQR9_9STRA